MSAAWKSSSVVAQKAFVRELAGRLNEAGDVIGNRVNKKASISPTPFQPYSEVFGLQRFRECELIHGRWAMLAILGALSVEALTGVTWQDAGKVSGALNCVFVVLLPVGECGHGQCLHGWWCRVERPVFPS